MALRRSIVDALRAGHARLGEFPVLDRQGQLLHLECPMRLQLASDGGFLPAEDWLAVASRYRLMTQIDLAGLELALAACAADGQGRCIHVAAESLATAGFVSAVRSRLEANPDAASRLWIEIAEVSFERLPPRLRNAGTVWRRCGARVGIEHAGAALRSLVRLGELDLDYVKVDAAFVHGLAGDAEQRERARGLVAFVHEFGARVIAEGVDDDDDLMALWRLGFDGATGHAASRQHTGQHVGRDGVDTGFDQAMSPV
jgi:EAL domain-containing protein (putative c-di-GMP-specific phosphodiesterase class I)